ncbi:uncharacterized protein AMSG_10178 [Thecamonas trahens ATCC 50062]|uniref:Uncharacterized protein n=1 Tax=Thecamonas trahens ATCC 50062 TaxID=461836 RepID=A0A0L0DRQ7_THETB|nr:hypothetical protein AMSG_10178 [Thecamonas trahens ATCC 50062]KNC54937.1 hypothetical protein AMSG_10178 [Thecamonas trahens ATCC 50062]|eukprot:XP_013753387.1 hypothetical protein AMSG_10178 [Thecamonas trahens ATCC 50062]
MYAEADLVDESNAEDEFDEVMATGAVGWKHVADIRVEFDDASGSHGEFKAAAVDESDDAGFVTLFAFDFAPMSRDVPTPISQGAYAPDRVYEFAFHSGTTFTLTTVGIDADSGDYVLTTFSGAKTVDEKEEPSFLSKYGTMIFMVAFLLGRPILTKWLGARQRANLKDDSADGSDAATNAE